MTQTAQAGTLRAQVPLVGAGFVLSFVMIGGGINTVGVFIHAIVESMHWASSALSLGVGVGAVTGALSAPAIGAVVDRWGVRLPMLAGVGLLAVGFAILAGMTSPWHFVVANVFLGAGFAACSLIPITVAIGILVRDRTALALGLAAAGSSAGALVLAPGMQALVDAFGWRAAYVALGTATVLTPLPFLAFALPRGPLRGSTSSADGGQRASAAELLAPRMRGLLALMVLPGVVTFGVTVHLVKYLAESGFPATTGALALGTSIAITAVGKIGGGVLADRFGPLWMMRGALLAASVALAVLAALDGPLMLVCFVALYGLSLGTLAAVTPALARELLGPDGFGSRFGLLQLTGMLAAAVGPVVAGVLRDRTGGYTEVIVLWVLATLMALAVAFAMRPPARSTEDEP